MLLSRLAGPRQTCLPTPPTTPVPAATAQPPEHLPVAALIHSRWPTRRRSIRELVLGMKTLFETRSAGRSTVRLLIFIFVLVDLAGAIPLAKAAQLQAARVTRIIKDVKLLSGQAAPRPAAVNDDVSAGTAVRTGTESRTELTFADLTITRLGANTIFSFNEGTRELGLGGGAMLVQVPPGGAEVKITAAAVTAGITGGTALFESNKGLPIKLLMLEGTGRFYRTGHPKSPAIVHGGEMVMAINGQITQPTKFNAALVYKTSKLITSFPKLPNADLIAAVIESQQVDWSGLSSNPPDRSIDTRDIAINANPPPTTTGAPSKFGPPAVITSPNPYVITSSTQISTDPTITTNGKTDFGKIYRGPAQDVSLVTWLGTTPTSFDTAFGDNFEPDANKLPLAGFLFSGLQLDGNPTISNPNGVKILGFVSENGITFSPSGTAFTFNGVDRIALVALNGSIDLSGVSFTNFGELFVYARGSGGNLTLAAPINNLRKVQLRAVNNVQVNAPVTLSNGTGSDRGFRAQAGNDFQTGSTVNANQITIESLGSIHINSSAQLLAMLDSVGNGGQITMLATASDSQVFVGGQVQADQGTVDIETTGLAGTININAATLHGDIVKIGALGTNGALNIGAGNLLNADTAIELYAGGSNGTINFLSNVTLTSPRNILAANTINIAQNVIVTINAVGAAQADVFTNNPNYFGFGGTGNPATSGTFGGAGAKNPLPFTQAPPFHP